LGWLFIVALMALQFWPAVPKSISGWLAFVVLAPPIYIIGESIADWLWSTRATKLISQNPSRTIQIVGGVLIGFVFLMVIQLIFMKIH
jgi:hypothetical protein